MIQITQVNSGIWRGPQPVSIQDFHLLQNTGIKTILDLETGAHWLRDGSPLLEAIRVDTYGIRTYSHPLGAILPPTSDEIKAAIAFLVNYQPVYVHCRQGVDRTGMVCAAYRIKVQRWGVAAAVNEMKALGFHWWYFFWLPILESL